MNETQRKSIMLLASARITAIKMELTLMGKNKTFPLAKKMLRQDLTKWEQFRERYTANQGIYMELESEELLCGECLKEMYRPIYKKLKPEQYGNCAFCLDRKQQTLLTKQLSNQGRL